MRIAFILSLAFLGYGCGGSDGTCSASDIDGTYFLSTTDIGGNCGDIGSIVEQYDHGAQTVDSGCTVAYERTSNEGCTVERSSTCDSVANNLRTTGVGVSTQEEGGSKLTGTITITVANLSTGATLCTGTYSISAVRQ